MSMSEMLSCTNESDWYPEGLLELSPKQQKILYYRGNIEIINQNKNVAVIGSRKATEQGLRLAYDTGFQAAKMGLNVVNGLAIGCDSQAVKGALEAGGKCIAIMPSGLE